MAPADKRSLWLGIATAGGTAGQFLLVPACQWLISTFGWGSALLVLAAGVFLIVPFGALGFGLHPLRKKILRNHLDNMRCVSIRSGSPARCR